MPSRLRGISSPWRDVPERYGPWWAVWRRHSQLTAAGAWDRILTRLLAEADAAGELNWAVSVDSTTARAHQHAATLSREVSATVPSHAGGPGSNYKNPPVEPVDHALGRSRGGLTTKLHALVDGRGRPLVIHAGPGHALDSPMLPILLAHLAVPRLGPGRPRTRPTCLIADKAYSNRVNRSLLRGRDVRIVIPERVDQAAHRHRRCSRGGQPVGYDRALYRGRNVIERGFNAFKQWRGLASRYDKLAINYRAGAVLRAILIWLDDCCDTP